MLNQTYAEFVGTNFRPSQKSFFEGDLELFTEVFKLVGEKIGLVYSDTIPIGREFMLQGMLITQLIDDLFLGRYRRKDDVVGEPCRTFPSASGGVLVFRFLSCMKWA